MPTRAGQRLAAGAVSRATAADDRQAGADRPLGLVLVRPRPAEIGQHAVAHELGHVPVEPSDLGGHGGLVGLDDLAHLLRVEPGGERGRADQVDEHDRELAPLGLGRPGRRAPGRGFLPDPHRWRGGPARAWIALSSTLRGPSGRPSSRRSASVSSGRASGVISASRNAAA